MIQKGVVYIFCNFILIEIQYGVRRVLQWKYRCFIYDCSDIMKLYAIALFYV